MLAVAVGAACIGAWPEGATLLFLFSFSGALEHYAFGRTQKEIAPCSATRQKPPRRLTRTEMKPRSPSKKSSGRGCSSSPARNFRGRGNRQGRDGGGRIQPSPARLRPWKNHRRHRARRHHQSLGPRSKSSFSGRRRKARLQKIITLIKGGAASEGTAQMFADKFSTYYTYGRAWPVARDVFCVAICVRTGGVRFHHPNRTALFTAP